MRSDEGLIIYIGYDKHEKEAWNVAAASIRAYWRDAVIRPLMTEQLRQAGYYTRPTEEKDGQLWDCISDAPMATEFANSRFLVPWLTRNTRYRWSLFVDCDVVFFADPRLMLEQINTGRSVYVVQHSYMPKEKEKMGGKLQTVYQRKNWSSVMLFDNLHPGTRRLTLRQINWALGRHLHRFCWLCDDEIGELDPGWNWLVNVQERPDPLYLAHFTLGGPWLPEWEPAPNDDVWLKANAWSETALMIRQRLLNRAGPSEIK